MGYKSELFVKPVDENLFCSICHEVFQDPVSCKDGHTFCSECIEQWLKTSKKCPLDNSVITDKKLARNYIAKGIIDNLEVYCYCTDGDEAKPEDTQAQVGDVVEEKCSWTGKLQDVAKHRGICGFQLLQCKHPNCAVKVQRRKFEEHMKTCKLRVIVCASCRVTMIANDKTLHEREYCPKNWVLCPNECLTPGGIKTPIIRMDLNDHLRNFCAKTILDCPFKDQGCSVQVERQHVDKHVQDNMAAHMMLLAKENKQLKEELNYVKESLKKSKGSYVWLTWLTGSAARNMPESPVFLECGHRWKLFLYFTIDGAITFYLVWFGDLYDVKKNNLPAFVRLSVLNNTPDEKSLVSVAMCHTFTKANDTLEFRKITKVAELRAYGEKVKVECSIQLCY